MKGNEFIAMQYRGRLNGYPVRIGEYVDLNNEEQYTVMPVALPSICAMWQWVVQLMTTHDRLTITGEYVTPLYMKKEDISDPDEEYFI